MNMPTYAVRVLERRPKRRVITVLVTCKDEQEIHRCRSFIRNEARHMEGWRRCPRLNDRGKATWELTVLPAPPGGPAYEGTLRVDDLLFCRPSKDA